MILDITRFILIAPLKPWEWSGPLRANLQLCAQPRNLFPYVYLLRIVCRHIIMKDAGNMALQFMCIKTGKEETSGSTSGVLR